MRRTLWAVGAPARVLLAGAIRVYQVTFSGAFGGRCKYYPSCSRYALTAVRTHGACKGTLLATWRVLRCNPMSLGGVDHVPPAAHRHDRTAAYDAVVPTDRASSPGPAEASVS